MRAYATLLCVAAAACGSDGLDLSDPVQVDLDRPIPQTLSSFNLFTWDAATASYSLNDEVVPYDLNTQLFSDYALKMRAIYVPPGASATAPDPARTLELPTGSIVMKSFSFPADLRAPTQSVTLVETRLLVRFEDGWQAFPYIWNETQTDAVLSPAGEIRPISFIGSDGEPVTATYLIPQKNQCSTCHNRKPDVASAPVLSLLGPTPRQIERDGQLERLGLPALDGVAPAYDFRAIEESGIAAIAPGELDRAARDYLDANCAHCHNPNGVQGISSQLFLNFDNTDLQRLGVCKQPGSAGAGTGGLTYDIVPGNAEQSILYFRVETTEPGAMMPLIGRSLEHRRGSELMKAWIDAMPPSSPPNCGL